MRLTLAAVVAAGLGITAYAESRAATDDPPRPPSQALAERAETDQRASRSLARPPAATPTPSASPTATRKPAVRPTATKTAKPARPRPVAGLNQLQMDNAKIIVDVGTDLNGPHRGLVVAIATAMQESTLLNLANSMVPESMNYPHQGVGADHDSVGLFQQRPSSGWGSVRDLMRPAYAARQFFAALKEIPGWQQLSIAGAAQAVQVSAFPDAYAQHEERASTVVAALT